MNKREPRYSSQELARRANELYESKIRAIVAGANHGRILAIDVETGDYQLGDESLATCQTLIDRHPDAQIFCLRIGHFAVARLGFHGSTEEA